MDVIHHPQRPTTFTAQTPSALRSVMEFDDEASLRAALLDGSIRQGCRIPVDGHEEFEEGGGGPSDDVHLLPPMDTDWITEGMEPSTSRPQSVEDEMSRLLALRSYGLLDHPEPLPTFEAISSLAASIFDVPMVVVCLVDLGRQWFLSSRGLGDVVRETPRKISFCAHAVQQVEDVLVVPDAALDARFVDNPAVTGPPHVRFYAGAVLVCPDTGHRLGTLAVIDRRPRPELFGDDGGALRTNKERDLRDLAVLAVEAMAARRREEDARSNSPGSVEVEDDDDDRLTTDEADEILALARRVHEEAVRSHEEARAIHEQTRRERAVILRSLAEDEDDGGDDDFTPEEAMAVLEMARRVHDEARAKRAEVRAIREETRREREEMMAASTDGLQLRSLHDGNCNYRGTEEDMDVEGEDICRRPVGLSYGRSTVTHHRAIQGSTIAGQQPRRRKRALVIDDTAVVRNHISGALSRIGFDVIQAASGFEGLTMLQNDVYDVVCCDFLMPDMDGPLVVEHYRSWESRHRPSGRRQHIIGFSSDSSSEHVRRGIDAGMNEFFPKGPRSLKKILERAVLISLDTGDGCCCSGDGCTGTNMTTTTSMLHKSHDGPISPSDRAILSAAADAAASETVNDGSVPPKFECLIVEDSMSVIKVLVRAVENRGWRTTVVHDGEDGLRLMKKRAWDAVLIDEDLPGNLAGSECVARFRRWESVMGNRASSMLRQQNIYLIGVGPAQDFGQLNGVDGVLSTPMKREEVEKVLDRAKRRIC